MLAGGEEHFAPPAEIDVETLARFAALCAKMRRFEKAGKKSIENITADCASVGTTMESMQIVVGLIFRCIRAHVGARQLAYWYVLDKLAKDHPETFGYLFGLHIEEVACDVMPWEVPELEPKLNALVEHWDRVFPSAVLLRIYNSSKERKWLASHPAEAAAMRRAEEEKWEQVEKEMAEMDGLDTYEQPCLAYMQGRCPWGANCTLFHPEGAEGTLPPETRLGDWRCSCGAINRHFRRRCFNCPKEKPQYRKSGQVKSVEEIALSKPDLDALAVLRQSFGYNPSDPDEAVAFWERKFAAEPLATYIEARRAAYVSRIIPVMCGARPAATASMKSKKHRSETAPPSEEAAPIRLQLPHIPDMSPAEKTMYLCRIIVEQGALVNEFVGYLFLLSQALPASVKDRSFTASRDPERSLLIIECFKLVFKSWSTWKASTNVKKLAMHPAIPFFNDVAKILVLLPLLDGHRREAEDMCRQVALG